MASIGEAAQKQAGPKAENAGEVAKAIRTPRKKEKRWEFSFRFFRQIDKFGLDGADIPNDWLVSFMARLQSLSAEKIENILDDQELAASYRYHPIDWSATNIPIKREELGWISAHYRDNPEEFPIEQLMISKGTGRFAGFFDEDWVFCIVLLDPMHNLQPAGGRFAYGVDDCFPKTCELSQVQLAVSTGIKKCSNVDCEARKEIETSLKGANKGYSEAYGVVLIKIDNPKTLEEANDLVAQKKAKDFAEIFEQGLCSLA